MSINEQQVFEQAERLKKYCSDTFDTTSSRDDNTLVSLLRMGSITLNVRYTNQVEIPWYLQLNQNKAFCFEIDKPAVLLESIAFRLLASINPYFCQYHFLDFSPEMSFGTFRSLSVKGITLHSGNLAKQIQVCHEEKTALRYQVLNDTYPTLNHLIEHTQANTHQHHFLFIANFNPNLEDRNPQLIEQLRSLVIHSTNCGYYLFIAGDSHAYLNDDQKIVYRINKEGVAKQSENPYLRYQLSDSDSAIRTCVAKLEEEDKSRRSREKPGISIEIGRDIKNRKRRFAVNTRNSKNYILIAGSPRTGKTNLLDVMILNGIKKYSPDQLNFYLLDFKAHQTSFGDYESFNHVKLLTTNPQFTAIALQQLIDSYDLRRKHKKTLPEVFVIIDEGSTILDDNHVSRLLRELVNRGAEFGIRVILTAVDAARTRFPSADNVRSSILLKSGKFSIDSVPLTTQPESIALINELKDYQREVGHAVGSAVFLDEGQMGNVLIDDLLPDLPEEDDRDEARKREIHKALADYNPEEQTNPIPERLIFPEKESRRVANNPDVWNWLSNGFPKDKPNRTVYVGGGYSKLGSQEMIVIDSAPRNHIAVFGPPSEPVYNCLGQIMHQLFSQESTVNVDVIDCLGADQYYNQLTPYLKLHPINLHKAADLSTFKDLFENYAQEIDQRSKNNYTGNDRKYLCILGLESLFLTSQRSNRTVYLPIYKNFEKIINEGSLKGVHVILYTGLFQTVRDLERNGPVANLSDNTGIKLAFQGSNISHNSLAINGLRNEVGVLIDLLNQKRFFSSYTSEGWNVFSENDHE